MVGGAERDETRAARDVEQAVNAQLQKLSGKPLPVVVGVEEPLEERGEFVASQCPMNRPTGLALRFDGLEDLGGDLLAERGDLGQPFEPDVVDGEQRGAGPHEELVHRGDERLGRGALGQPHHDCTVSDDQDVAAFDRCWLMGEVVITLPDLVRSDTNLGVEIPDRTGMNNLAFARSVGHVELLVQHVTTARRNPWQNDFHRLHKRWQICT